MIKKEFRSNKTKDGITITYFAKSHKSNLDISGLDDISDHMNLLNETLTYLKNNGIQWVCVEIKNEPIIPENTLFFKHEKFNRICCHVEGFESFYLKNLLSIVPHDKINLNNTLTNKNSNGWTIVGDNNKKLKRAKFNSLKIEINKLISNE